MKHVELILHPLPYGQGRKGYPSNISAMKKTYYYTALLSMYY
jgi:hypothetical protein